MINKKIIYLLIFLAIFLSLASASVVLAQNETIGQSELVVQTLSIDEPTILKGYTFSSASEEFKVGLVDQAVTVAVDLTIKKIPDDLMKDQLSGEAIDAVKASAIWEFDIKTKQGQLGDLKKPIYLALKHDGLSMNRKIFRYWDKASNQWVVLPSSLDIEKGLVRSLIHLPYARLALFDSNHEYEAWASWYPTELTRRDTLGCASNMYPMNTRLRVCRLDDLAKCVTTTVISVGPYVNNRIIDLTRKAFDTIGNSRGGVLAVRVVPLDKTALKQTPAEIKDMKRVNDIILVQTALESYFKDINLYPVADQPIILGLGQQKVLCDSGFSPNDDGCNKVYLNAVPRSLEPNGAPYIYVREQPDQYSIYFNLEFGAYRYAKGDFLAYKKGIVRDTTKLNDSDHDGLTDEREQRLGSNPNNPDTNGDGFSDGYEIAQAFGI